MQDKSFITSRCTRLSQRIYDYDRNDRGIDDNRDEEGRAVAVGVPIDLDADRWSHPGFWLKLLDALVDAGAVTRGTAIDRT
jgi:hypothetical protein